MDQDKQITLKGARQDSPDMRIATAKFLTVYIETHVVDQACKAAGISKHQAHRIIENYQNKFKAKLAILGLTEDNVLTELKKLILSPQDVSYDTMRGKLVSIPDNHLRIKAIETYLKLIGALSDGPLMVVNINQDKEKENRLYLEMKEQPEFKAMETKMLQSIEKLREVPQNAEAKKE